ncbi:delta-60 repeat domain-containing protein [Flavobacterium lacisediminis]|uniref:Delta-60 repeat domain-containing protein n=1 Tax=Flavobacterium lacisediminis TaxID=2989705 RepID=A0ABT3EJT0_9FLAO|nr:delta-60 repeat domain-containing protein [Flavobacterium lacisediminis]MCW1148834.1 delta-60 repeat domain-containing protein [Flavobacterium lacisediminis]
MKKLFFFLTLLCSFATTAQVAGDVAQTFGPMPGFNGSVATTALQTDGKVLVGGDFTAYNSVSANRIIRLNADGTRDASFNIGTGFSGEVLTIAIQSDGKILVGGSFTAYNGVTATELSD